MIRNRDCSSMWCVGTVVVARGAGASLLAFSGSRPAAELIAALAALTIVATATALLGLRRDRETLRASLAQLRRQAALLPPSGLPVGTKVPDNLSLHDV